MGTLEQLVYEEGDLPCRLCGGDGQVEVIPKGWGGQESQLDECPWCLRRELSAAAHGCRMAVASEEFAMKERDALKAIVDAMTPRIASPAPPSRGHAEREIQNAVYAAVVGLLECWERSGLDIGSGHHAAQDAAAGAAAAIADRLDAAFLRAQMRPLSCPGTPGSVLGDAPGGEVSDG